MKYKIAIVAITLLLVLTCSSACVVVVNTTVPNQYNSGNNTGVPTYYQTVTPKAQLVIQNNKLTHDAAGKAIGTITIKNVSTYTAQGVQVTGKFYDSGNNLVYSTQDSLLSLNGGESWDFTFTCNSANCNKVTTFTVDLTYG